MNQIDRQAPIDSSVLSQLNSQTSLGMAELAGRLARIKTEQDMLARLAIGPFISGSINTLAGVWSQLIDAESLTTSVLAETAYLSSSYSAVGIRRLPALGCWTLGLAHDPVSAIPTYVDSYGSVRAHPSISIRQGSDEERLGSVIEPTHPIYYAIDSNDGTIGMIPTPYQGKVTIYVKFDPSVYAGVNRLDLLTMPGTEVVGVKLKRPDGSWVTVENSQAGAVFPPIVFLEAPVQAVGMAVTLQSTLGTALIRTIGAYFETYVSTGVLTKIWEPPVGTTFDQITAIGMSYTGQSAVKLVIRNNESVIIEQTQSESGLTVDVSGSSELSVQLILTRKGVTPTVEAFYIKADVS